jgi:hypothetical protein
LRPLLPPLLLPQRGADLFGLQTQFHLICIHLASHFSRGTWTNAVQVKIFLECGLGRAQSSSRC